MKIIKRNLTSALFTWLDPCLHENLDPPLPASFPSCLLPLLPPSPPASFPPASFPSYLLPLLLIHLLPPCMHGDQALHDASGAYDA